MAERTSGRSLRVTTTVVMVFVVLSPVVFLLVTNLLEALGGYRSASRVEYTANAAAALVKALPPGETPTEVTLTPVLDRWRQQVRVLGPDGTVVAEAGSLVGTSWLFQLGDLVYGQDRARVLEALDDTEGPTGEREEVVRARQDGQATRCWQAHAGNLHLCAAAVTVKQGDATWVVHVQGSSRRALQTLYESRRQLLKLTGYVLVLALALSWWIGRRIVKPVEQLRAQLLDRARAEVPRADLQPAGRDEVSGLASAFNALLSALDERGRANEAFLADVAHELKTPVAALRASAERLSEAKPLELEQQQMLGGVVARSSQKLETLISQFLELAKAEAGLPNEARGAVDVVALTKGVAASIRDSGRWPKVTLEVESALAQASVQGITERLESALHNVIDNAASFAASRVEVTLALVGERVELVVTDDGPGIPPEVANRVFDRFFTTRADRHGTGLGLALTRAVIEAQGGTIHVEPRPSGARFVIRLPFTPNSQPGQTASTG